MKMMANRATPERLTVPLVDGTYNRLIKRNAIKASHCLSFDIRGALSAGTMVITAKAPGSSVFEEIPNGTIDLTALTTVLMTFPVSEYKFVVSSMAGSAADNQVIVTDTPLEL